MELQLAEATIEYDRKGNGPVLFFIHGFLESKDIWAPLIARLQSDFTCLTMDIPGHGNSVLKETGVTMKGFSAFAKAVLIQENIKQCHVIGHSMGGYVACELLKYAPDRLQSITLLNSTSAPDSEMRQNDRNRAIKLVGTMKDTFIRMSLSNLFNEKSREKYKKEIIELKKTAMNMSTEDIITSIIAMRDRTSSLKTLQHASIPTYILSGTEDTVIPMNHSIKESGCINAKLLTLNGSHMGHLENVDEIHKHCITTIKSC